MDGKPCVYLLASRPRGALYVGVTSRLNRRVWEHRHHFVSGHTAKYGIYRLVWYELHESMESAIQREKALKRWRRAWKIALVEQMNPRWDDLFPVA